MKKLTLLLCGIGCLLVLGGGISARAASPAVPAGDVKFAKKAALGGMLEVKLGEIAQKQAASSDVKEFGAMMVTDHGKAGSALAAIATKEGIKLPANLGKKQQAMVDELSKLDGKAFDTAYVTAMVKDHREDLAEFKAAEKNLSDPELKSFASSTAPIIETHLKKIEAIQAALK